MPEQSLRIKKIIEATGNNTEAGCILIYFLSMNLFLSMNFFRMKYGFFHFMMIRCDHIHQIYEFDFFSN